MSAYLYARASCVGAVCVRWCAAKSARALFGCLVPLQRNMASNSSSPRAARRMSFPWALIIDVRRARELWGEIDTEQGPVGAPERDVHRVVGRYYASSSCVVLPHDEKSSVDARGVT